MKTTIKAHGGGQITLTPTTDGVWLNCLATESQEQGGAIQSVAIRLTPDQMGALIFGGEMALEAVQMRAMRSAL